MTNPYPDWLKLIVQNERFRNDIDKKNDKELKNIHVILSHFIFQEEKVFSTIG